MGSGDANREAAPGASGALAAPTAAVHSPDAVPAAPTFDGVLAFAALLAAGAAVFLLAAPLDRFRRWGTPGAPGQELLFTSLLLVLLLFVAAGWAIAWIGHRRFPRPSTGLALAVSPGQLSLLVPMLVVAWYADLPPMPTERLLVVAWLAVRVLVAGAIAAGIAVAARGAPPRQLAGLHPAASAALGALVALLLAAGLAWLPWPAPELLAKVGAAVVLLDAAALGMLLLSAARRSPLLGRLHASLACNTVARLLADGVAAASGGVRDDLFTLAQLCAVVASAAWSWGAVRDLFAEHELRLVAGARVGEEQREVARQREESATRQVSGAWTRELLRELLKAVEAMHIGLTVASPQGRILYVNPADAELHGWRRDELIGKPVTVYSPSPGQGPDGEPHPWVRVSVNVTRAGERFPVRLHSDVVRDEEGEVVAMVTLCEDIRDELRVKAALQRRERVLEVLEVATERFLRGGLQPDHEAEVLAGLRRAAEVEHAHLTRLAPPVPACATSAETPADPDVAPPAATPCDAAVAALRNLGRRLPPGSPWVGRVDELAPEVGAALQDAGVASLACVPASVAGEQWALLSLATAEAEREWSPIEVEALEIAARILGAAEESEQSRLALHASEARYRAVVESASDLIQSVGHDGRVRFVNEAWAAALGWSREEAVGLSVWDIVDPADHEHCRETLRGVMAGDSRSNVVTTFHTRSGGRLRMEGNVAPQLEGGLPVATLGIFRNVTERERLARMRDEFVATVSHELRTPLTSMLGALSLLRGRRLDEHPDRRRELTEVAVRNGERLLRLVNELLDVQKLEAGQLRVHLVAAEVVELLEEAAKGVEALAEGKGVRLNLDCEASLRVCCDRERLVQVMFNLLSNAIKFSPAGEEVWAAARPVGETVQIEVLDRGSGVPPEFRRQLFEPFSQADSGSARSTGGSGLGLFISRRLVEAMAGAIRLEERQGGGTRAVVVVPQADVALNAARE